MTEQRPKQPEGKNPDVPTQSQWKAYRPPPGHSELRITVGYVGALLVILAAFGAVLKSKLSVSGWVWVSLPVLGVLTVVKVAQRRRVWRVLAVIVAVLSVAGPIKVALNRKALLSDLTLTCPKAMKIGDTAALSVSFGGRPIAATWDLVSGSGVLSDSRDSVDTPDAHLEQDRMDAKLTAVFRSTATGSVRIHVTALADVGNRDLYGPYLDPFDTGCEFMVT